MRGKSMNTEQLKQRLDKNRPMMMVSMRMPEDVVEELKQVAPLLGFTGYQPLMRAYIGQGLRADLARLAEEEKVTKLVASLRQQGVDEGVLATAVAEAKGVYEV